MRIALVSRELYPYVGGGIAPIVAAQARILARVAEVTLVTSANHRARHEQLVAAADPRLPPADVRMVFVEEPPEKGQYLCFMHNWSARVYRALREAYADAPPDLVEFCDYLGEGFVTVQAAQTSAPWLGDALVAVRLHTTSELVSILDGHLGDEFETIATHDLERACLRSADRILWSGGDILRTYERYYGADRLAPGAQIPDGFFAYGDDERAVGAGPERLPGERPKLLYVGRMERRKGVQNLLRAVTSLERRDFTLTLLGGDTLTGPLQTSLKSQLQLMADGDDRVWFADAVPRAQVPALVRDHDVVVVPSLWECWPNTAREALMHNRPILCTPVGGLTAMARPGRSGWLTRDTSPESIAEGIEALLDDPDRIADLIVAGGPRSVFEELTDPDALIARYERLIAEERPRRRSRVRAARVADPARPLVSVVVPYFKLERYVEETLASVAGQTYPNVETLIVNDGSLRPQDAGLWAAAERLHATVITQANSGLGAARNTGVSQARGRFILPLDADDTIDPSFIERCVDALEAAPELAYVGTWVDYVDDDGAPASDEQGGYMPYGNDSRLMTRNNVAGTCSTLIRREVFDRGFRYSVDMTSYEDWLLYRELHEAGWYGAIIPERLFHYRIRGTSMMREVGTPLLGTLYDELRAHTLERRMRWTREGGGGGGDALATSSAGEVPA